MFPQRRTRLFQTGARRRRACAICLTARFGSSVQRCLRGLSACLGEVNYGRSLARHLKRFDLPLAFVEWATLAQDRAAWHQRVT